MWRSSLKVRTLYRATSNGDSKPAKFRFTDGEVAEVAGDKKHLFQFFEFMEDDGSFMTGDAFECPHAYAACSAWMDFVCKDALPDALSPAAIVDMIQCSTGMLHSAVKWKELCRRLYNGFNDKNDEVDLFVECVRESLVRADADARWLLMLTRWEIPSNALRGMVHKLASKPRLLRKLLDAMNEWNFSATAGLDDEMSRLIGIASSVLKPTQINVDGEIFFPTRDHEYATIDVLGNLKFNAVTEYVFLYEELIRNEGVAILAESLRYNTMINTLELSSNGISEDGINDLSEALKVNVALHQLRLSNNQIRAGGAVALASALRINSTLGILDITSNYIGGYYDKGVFVATPDGSTAIAAALKENTALTHLSLSLNNIGDTDATALADALKVNTVLEYLELTQNQIGAGGAADLGEALNTNTTLKEMLLGFNPVGDDGAKALAAALKGNNTLKKLKVAGDELPGYWEHGITSGGRAALEKAVRGKEGFTLQI